MGSAKHDPEREWMRGARIYSCDGCADEVIVAPAEGAKGDAPGPTA